jgi:hypothetical protein
VGTTAGEKGILRSADPKVGLLLIRVLEVGSANSTRLNQKASSSTRRNGRTPGGGYARSSSLTRFQIGKPYRCSTESLLRWLFPFGREEQ